mmetsp:Transcript_3912/g.7457  ORF Transcript_3912/g.7457 Transcript_3912/m.7457 type:complete len:226 (+) Transcript_3912:151-828(+)
MKPRPCHAYLRVPFIKPHVQTTQDSGARDQRLPLSDGPCRRRARRHRTQGHLPAAHARELRARCLSAVGHRRCVPRIAVFYIFRRRGRACHDGTSRLPRHGDGKPRFRRRGVVQSSSEAAGPCARPKRSLRQRETRRRWEGRYFPRFQGLLRRRRPSGRRRSDGRRRVAGYRFVAATGSCLGRTAPVCPSACAPFACEEYRGRVSVLLTHGNQPWRQGDRGGCAF